jgi:3-oxoacyl-[acyl-carrier protein] reductase
VIGGDPRDVADIVVFLATDAARWMTGQNIAAGGGAF